MLTQNCNSYNSHARGTLVNPEAVNKGRQDGVELGAVYGSLILRARRRRHRTRGVAASARL
jgi:hypothetical protein